MSPTIRSRSAPAPRGARRLRARDPNICTIPTSTSTRRELHRHGTRRGRTLNVAWPCDRSLSTPSDLHSDRRRARLRTPHGIVHRDIKPATSRPTRPAKLMDFGLAKRSGLPGDRLENGVSGLRPRSGSAPDAPVCHRTVAYMSPSRRAGGARLANGSLFFGAVSTIWRPPQRSRRCRREHLHGS